MNEKNYIYCSLKSKKITITIYGLQYLPLFVAWWKDTIFKFYFYWNVVSICGGERSARGHQADPDPNRCKFVRTYKNHKSKTIGLRSLDNVLLLVVLHVVLDTLVLCSKL